MYKDILDRDNNFSAGTTQRFWRRPKPTADLTKRFNYESGWGTAVKALVWLFFFFKGTLSLHH